MAWPLGPTSTHPSGPAATATGQPETSSCRSSHELYVSAAESSLRLTRVCRAGMPAAIRLLQVAWDLGELSIWPWDAGDLARGGILDVMNCTRQVC